MKPLNPHIGIVGIGYVGLPLACAFAEHFKVVGFDVSETKIAALKQGFDPMGELSDAEIAKANLTWTTEIADLAHTDVIIVTVPTPIDTAKNPDLTPLESASLAIGAHLKPGHIVVYESTVYPGVTEEFCVPILEKVSGLTCGTDFSVGYSPERLSPGDPLRTVAKIVKVVSGSDPQTAQFLADLYGKIVPAGIHLAPSIKVAEAAKVIENTQRDLNVALMNELSIIFHKMGINTLDVIEAASTKWNFIKMTPGLVGGHCIGVDPYYLTHKAELLGYHPQVILAGRRINDGMGQYVAEQTIKQLIQADCAIKGANVVILGMTFKENVSDIRNSKVIDIIRELEAFGARVSVVDPLADPAHTQHEYGVTLTPIDSIQKAEAIVLAVPHRQFDGAYLDALMAQLASRPSVFVDLKGHYRQGVSTHYPELMYWEL